MVPYRHDTLPSLLHHLNSETVASFNFRNVFFYLYWENATSLVEALVDSAEVEQSPGYLRSLYKTRRLEKVHRHGVRSKYVVKPENVIEVRCGGRGVVSLGLAIFYTLV